MSNNKKFLDINNPKLIFTHNNINDKIKKNDIIISNQVILELINLSLITKQSHWNMRGDNFIGIHKMLDDFYKKIIEHQDILAERITQLGGVALGIVEIVHDNSLLKMYPTDIFDVKDHLKELVKYYSIVANYVRETISKLKDINTTDILISISRDLDKFLWLIESNITL